MANGKSLLLDFFVMPPRRHGGFLHDQLPQGSSFQGQSAHGLMIDD
jgi:hypothetical protein